MEKLNVDKVGLLSIMGAIGAFISTLFGGWNMALTTLAIFMCIDFVMGLFMAGVLHKSKKTETGRLESRAGWKGLCRKCTTLLMVLVAVRLDLALGTNFLKDGVVIAFITNETISIVENAGIMGVWIPPVLVKAIEILQKKAEKVDDINDSK